ncbi:MAG: hypothetical protein F9K23_05975 [Bacteroidetes bacterium]|nr:MAG: hypothetical protein F9K23_05975 [Bacteroidota bacterium]
MAKKTTTPAPAISIDAVKEQVKTHLTPKDTKGNPAHDRHLTDSQRTWLIIDEITDGLKSQNPQGGITKALVVKAVTELVQEGIIKQRLRKPPHISEYTSVH